MEEVIVDGDVLEPDGVAPLLDLHERSTSRNGYLCGNRAMRDVHLHREAPCPALRLRARGAGASSFFAARRTEVSARRSQQRRGARRRRRRRPSRHAAVARGGRTGATRSRSGALGGDLARRCSLAHLGDQRGEGEGSKRGDDRGRASFGILTISRRGCAGTATRRVDKRAVRRPRRAADGRRSGAAREARFRRRVSELERSARSNERGVHEGARADVLSRARAHGTGRRSIAPAALSRAGAREGAATGSGRASPRSRWAGFGRGPSAP